MKTRCLLLALVASLLCSCASVDLTNPEQARPLAGVATAAYVAQGDYLERVSRESLMRSASAQIRVVAKSDNPTTEAAALALELVSMDAAYRRVAQQLIRLYAPRLEGASVETARVVLLSVADGILDALPTK